MNELSLLFDFVFDHFKNSTLVHTVTFVDTRFIDNNKNNIYQLVNVDYNQSRVEDDAIIARFVITCVQQRNISPKVTDSKLRLNTNLIDNLNETHATLQRFINVLTRQHQPNNIELYSQTALTKLEDWNKNGLDGHQLTVELSIPNIGSAC